MATFETVGVRYDLLARDKASQVFARAGYSAGKLERGLGKLGHAAKLAGLALGGTAAAVGVESVKSAIKFQSAMTKVQTQAGASAKDVKTLSNRVLELGKYAEQSPQELADSLYHLKSVGLDNAKAMKALKTASDLAAVGGASLEDTTNALAGAWRSGIKGATNFGQAAATVNAIIGAGNMRMSDMVDAMGTGFLPAAKSFGLSLNEVGAALALMTDEGVPANAAATRLRMTFSLLGAPSHKAAGELKSIGLSQDSLAKDMRKPNGLIVAIGDLKSHMEKAGLTAVQQSQLLSNAFGGGRSSAAILTMINNFDTLKKKQDQINGSMGKFGAAVKAQRKTAEAQWALLKSSIDVLTVKIGEKLLPIFVTVVKYLNNKVLPVVSTVAGALGHMLSPVWNGLKSGAKKATSFIGDFMKGVKHGLRFKGRPITADQIVSVQEGAPATAAGKAGAAVRSFFQRVIDIGIKPLKNTLGGVFSTISKDVSDFLRGTHNGLQFKGRAITPDQIVSVQQGAPSTMAGKAGAAMRTFFQQIAAGGIKAIDVHKLGALLGNAVTTAIGWIGRHMLQVEHALISAMGKVDWVGIGKAVGSRAFGFAIGFINTFFDPLMSGAFWRKNWKTMLEVAASLIPAGKFAGVLGKTLFKDSKFLGPITRGMGRLADLMLKPIRALGRAIADGIRTAFAKEFPRTAAFLENTAMHPIVRLRSLLSTAAHKAGAAITNGISKGAEGVTGLMLRIVKRILSPFARAGGWLVGKGRDIIAGLSKGLIDRAQAVWKWVGGIDGRITQFFRNAGGWLYGHGRDIIGGLIKGLTDRLAAVGGWFNWIKAHTFDPIVHAVKSLFGIASPSKVMHGLGSNVMEGFVKGMLLHNPLAIAKKLIKDIPGLIGSAGQAIGGRFVPTGTGSNSPGALQAYAKSTFGHFGWGPDQFEWLVRLWNGESGWNYRASNPSGAYGVPQALPGSKMASVSPDWRTNGNAQVVWGEQYIKSHYGTPENAFLKWLARQPHWYGNGLVNGIFRKPTLIGVGERGAERVNVTPMHGGGRGGAMRITGTLDLGNGLVGIVRGEIEDALAYGKQVARMGAR